MDEAYATSLFIANSKASETRASLLTSRASEAGAGLGSAVILVARRKKGSRRRICLNIAELERKEGMRGIWMESRNGGAYLLYLTLGLERVLMS